MLSAIHLIASIVEIPWGSSLPFKGDLYAGIPSQNKPKDVKDDVWAEKILNLAIERSKAYIVIPNFFWSGRSEPLQGLEHPLCIKFPDTEFGVIEHGTPQDVIQGIVGHLKDGEDVLFLSPTTQVSGFIPAILGMLAEPNCHIDKILWPIEHGAGYQLTPIQRGYLAGLYDANRLTMMGLGESSPLN